MLMPSIFGEDLFDDFMRDFPFYDDKDEKRIEKKLYGRRGKNLMKTDIRETDHSYELEMDLPGFKKDEVKVTLEDGYLTVRAEHSHASDDQDDQGNIIRRERVSGSCSRSFYVGEEVTEQDIKAKYDNGELKIVLPKKQPAPQVETSQRIAIE